MEVRLMVRGYPEVLDRAEHFDKGVPLGEMPGAGTIRLLPARRPDSGLPLWLIDCPPLYQRAGGTYQDPDGRDGPDTELRFAACSRASVPAAQGAHGLKWRQAVCHAKDWNSRWLHLLLRPADQPR